MKNTGMDEVTFVLRLRMKMYVYCYQTFVLSFYVILGVFTSTGVTR